MNINFTKTSLLLASMFIFSDLNAAMTCVQDSDPTGASGYFVNDGTTTYNGKNGTTIRRCGMSRRDQGTAQFTVTSAPPASATPGSASPILVTTPDPSTPNQIFQPNISFMVPSVVNGVNATVTLYSGSSSTNLTAGPQVTLAPNTTYTSPNLTAGNYYSVHVQYLNSAGTAGADSAVISPFKFDPCNGAPICNAKMTYTSPVSGSTWFYNVNQNTSATVTFTAVYSGTPYDVCVGISNASKIFGTTKVTSTGNYTIGPTTFSGSVLGALGCQGQGCTVRLIKDPSCGSATANSINSAVGAAWNIPPTTYLGTILP